MRRTITILALLAVLGLLAAACGDDTTATTDAPTTSASNGPAQPEPVAPSEGLPAPAVEGAPVDVLVAGFNDAGFDLLRTQPPADNVVFSPSSIGHALLMARAAADPATAAAIDDAFGLPEGISAHDAWAAIDQQIGAAVDAEESLVVAIADRIWPRLDVEPDQEWVDLLASHHRADVVPLDFGDEPTSRQTINDWVSDQTRTLIPELLPAGFIRPDTVLVLTDALYFEAKWRLPFGKYGTEMAPFTRLDGTTVDVELMHEIELVGRRGLGDGYAAAELAYRGDEFSMTIIVPEEGSFDDIRDRLDQGLLDEIDEFAEGTVDLYMPQWETTSAIDLLDWLTGLGAAPGSYPAISPAAFLGAAVHGADISVDDEGTVAAAATALGFNESAGGQPDITVRADRPFLYVIRHGASGLVLFAGAVTDPTA